MTVASRAGRSAAAARIPAVSGFAFCTVAIAAVVLALGALPMGRIVLAALAPGGVPDLAAFAARLGKAAALRATWHTLDTAVCGTGIAFVLGAAFAVAVTMTDVPGRRLLGFLVLLPLMIAPQVTALAFLHLVGPSSALLGAVGLAPPPGSANPLLGRTGIILLYGVQHAPIVFIALRAGLVRVPADLTEAARAAGATPLAALLGIVLPAIRPHLAAAAALAFVSGVGNFGIPALLGLPVNYLTLSTLIYQKLSSTGPSVLPEVAALSVLIGGMALAGVALQSLALRRTRHALGIGSAAQFRLGGWRWPLAGAAWITLTIILLLPALALVATSLVPTVGVPLTPGSATLANYAEVLTRQASTLRALRNSTLLSAGAALILAALAIPIALVTRRMAPGIRRFLVGSLQLSYAVPGIVLAIACILLFLKPLPLIGSLYGSAAILLVAYLMRFATLALQPVDAAVGQIAGDLSEAAAAAGAGPLRRLATITAPLTLPAATAGALLVVMSAFNELTVSALLWSSGNETLGVVLFSLEEAGLATHAAAIAVVSVAAVVVLLAVLDRLGRRLPAGILPWR